MDVRRWTVAITLFAVLLGACSPDGGDGDAVTPDGGEESDDEQYEEGNPPTAWDDALLVSLDEVAREGDRVELELTLASRRERTIEDEDLRLVTNGGIELPEAADQDRTIPARSLATMNVTATGVPEGTRSLTLTTAGLSLDFDLPGDDGVRRWRPAPRRQVGFTDVVLRDNSPLAVVPYTFRTEGFMSEVTFLGINRNRTDADLCDYGDCHIEDSEGRTYPVLGSYTFPEREGRRVRGTLRFFGQIPAEETELRLVLEGSSSFATLANPAFEHEFVLPTAEESPLTVAAAHTRPDPFEVGSTIGDVNGLQVELGEMAFFEERIQLTVTATNNGDESRTLNWSGNSVLIDPTGYEHELLGPAGGASLEVEPGQTLDAVLVFMMPLAPDVHELHLRLATSHETSLETTIRFGEGTSGQEDEPEGETDDEGNQ